MVRAIPFGHYPTVFPSDPFRQMVNQAFHWENQTNLLLNRGDGWFVGFYYAAFPVQEFVLGSFMNAPICPRKRKILATYFCLRASNTIKYFDG